jgi:hypothetical protein
MNKCIIMAVVSLATGVAWAQTPTVVVPQGQQLYTLVAGPDGQQVLRPVSGQVQVPQGAVVTAPPPNQIMPLSGTAAAQYNVAAAQMAVRRTGDPNAQAALDNARLQLLQQQLAERQAQQAQAQAMRAQREYERQIRVRQAEIDRFHRQRAERIGWVADWALTRPR